MNWALSPSLALLLWSSWQQQIDCIHENCFDVITHTKKKNNVKNCDKKITFFSLIFVAVTFSSNKRKKQNQYCVIKIDLVFEISLYRVLFFAAFVASGTCMTIEREKKKMETNAVCLLLRMWRDLVRIPHK